MISHWSYVFITLDTPICNALGVVDMKAIGIAESVEDPNQFIYILFLNLDGTRGIINIFEFSLYKTKWRIERVVPSSCLHHRMKGIRDNRKQVKRPQHFERKGVNHINKYAWQTCFYHDFEHEIPRQPTICFAKVQFKVYLMLFRLLCPPKCFMSKENNIQNIPKWENKKTIKF